MEAGVFLGLGVATSEVEACTRIIADRLGADISLIGLDRKPVAGHDPGRWFEPDTVYRVSRPELLVIPGGFGSLVLSRDVDLRRWLRDRVEDCRAILTVSTGALLLASTGMLTGRTVAGHWLCASLMRRHGVELSARPVTITGHIVSAAGSVAAREAAAGMCDLVLYRPRPARV